MVGGKEKSVVSLTSKIFKFVGMRQQDKAAAVAGNREPLDHPAMCRMTLAQLADLPMPSYMKENCTGSVRIV
jgi:hypothetical protein